jgi:8-oxo-dGTP pyrophosphatase MutT (NUDIX family)
LSSAADGAEAFDADSVAALIVSEKGRYLLQLREDLPGVDFPNMWGLFGGSRDTGESPDNALLRELREELAFTAGLRRLFLISTFDARQWKLWNVRRAFYEVPSEESEIHNFVLGEGSSFGWFSVDDIMKLQVIPFDLAAILLHSQNRRSFV